MKRFSLSQKTFLAVFLILLPISLSFLYVYNENKKYLEEDILKADGLHANCYISKPIKLNQFVRVVKSIEDFWLTIVKLPRGE